MVSESSTVGVLPLKQTAQQNPNLPQHKNTFFPASKQTSFHNEPQTSRKRPRIYEQQPSFQQPVATNPIHLGLSDTNSSRKQDFHFVSWPSNFSFQSNEVNKSVQQGSEAKQPPFSVKNRRQLPGKTSPFGIGMNLSNAGSFALDGFNVGSEKTEVDLSVDFSKAIEDAISRIESLIPSLQKLVKNDHSLEQKSADHSAIPLGKEKDLVATNELRFTDNSDAFGDTMLSKQGAQMLTKCNFPAPSPIEWNRMKGFKLQKNSNAQLISQVPVPLFKADFGSSESVKGKLSRDGSFASRKPMFKADFGRSESLKGKLSGDGSFASHASKHVKGSRLMIKGPLHSKVAPHDQISEDMSWNSYTSFDSTDQQSGSPSYSSGGYESSGSDSYDSDESEQLHEKIGYSARMKQPEFTDSTASGYADTSSYSNSLDDYSEAKSSSQMSSARLHKWDPQKERGKRRGRLKRLGRKLGMIFHHHHHHHHHHYRDEPDPRHARSFWKRLGEMFHHSRNANHHQKRKSEKPRKSDVKTVAKGKQQGHFHALVSGLMKHMKHSKKPKQVKSGFKGLGSGHHGGKKKGKKLLWWPKVHGGRGGVKVANKGKVRLGNFRTKSFAAAKLILKK